MKLKSLAAGVVLALAGANGAIAQQTCIIDNGQRAITVLEAHDGLFLFAIKSKRMT